MAAMPAGKWDVGGRVRVKRLLTADRRVVRTPDWLTLSSEVARLRDRLNGHHGTVILEHMDGGPFISPRRVGDHELGESILARLPPEKWANAAVLEFTPMVYPLSHPCTPPPEGLPVPSGEGIYEEVEPDSSLGSGRFCLPSAPR